MLFHAWRVSGANPYCLYNSLDERFRPLHDPEAPARPPQFPERVRAFIYACANYAHELEQKNHAALIRGIARAVRA